MIVPGRSAFAGLSLLGVALIGLITFEIAGPEVRPTPMPERSTQQSRSAPTAPATDQHALWLNDILARPLFSPDRRPMGSGTVRGLPRLTGIVVSGSRKIAIFAAPTGQPPLVREAGSRIGAYNVTAVEDDGVTVAGPSGTSRIRPLFDSSPPPPAPANLMVHPPALPRAQTK